MNLSADTIQYFFFFLLFFLNRIHVADSKLHFSLSNCIAMIDANHETNFHQLSSAFDSAQAVPYLSLGLIVSH